MTVMGLGRFGGGIGVTRWLAGQGAKVLVTDHDPQEKLADSLREIEDLVEAGTVELRLGDHDEADFRDTDLVVVNPAVSRPWKNQYLLAAADEPGGSGGAASGSLATMGEEEENAVVRRWDYPDNYDQLSLPGKIGSNVRDGAVNLVDSVGQGLVTGYTVVLIGITVPKAATFLGDVVGLVDNNPVTVPTVKVLASSISIRSKSVAPLSTVTTQPWFFASTTNPVMTTSSPS